jgi:hypothetical protein
MISFHAAQIEIWKELFVPMVLKLELPAMDIDVVCWLVAVHAIEARCPRVIDVPCLVCLVSTCCSSFMVDGYLPILGMLTFFNVSRWFVHPQICVAQVRLHIWLFVGADLVSAKNRCRSDLRPKIGADQISTCKRGPTDERFKGSHIREPPTLT